MLVESRRSALHIPVSSPFRTAMAQRQQHFDEISLLFYFLQAQLFLISLPNLRLVGAQSLLNAVAL